MTRITTIAGLALAPFLMMSPARADDCCPQDAPRQAAGPRLPQGVHEAQDGEDEAQVIRELEGRLNEVLVVEENGRIVMREEFKAALPFPPERVEMMLGALVELGPDGKIKVKDPNTIRPYLPMIRRFLSPESMQRLRELQNLPPEERREALQRMFGRGGGEEQPAPAPAPTPRPETRPTPTPAPSPRRVEPTPAPRENRGLDDRLDRLERRFDRLEELLRGNLERRGDEREPERRRGLGDLFGRRREREPEGRQGLGDVRRRMEVWRRGFQRLSEILEPQDFERFGRVLERMRGELEPGDLQDRDALLEKLQGSVDPADMGRFMEIFSEFLATEEGREFAAEVERVIERLESVMNSERGGALGDQLDRLGQGELRDQLDRLMRGRGDEERGTDRERHQDERRRDRAEREAPRHEQPRGLPEGARLY
jgi:hypothetical protein